jgi:formate-dependent nitrite reductase membrane component NrfD
VLSLVFLLLTTALLVFDLKRPDRFAYILLKPNWRSWLVWGAWILLAFGGAGGLWLLGGLTDSESLLAIVTLPALLLAVAAAGYSAFLFGQAEGRDFWQSPLVLPHLILAAVVAGAAALCLLASAWRPTLTTGCGPGVPAERCANPTVGSELGSWLFFGLAVYGLVLLIELLSRHPVHDVATAARLITRGRYRLRFWGGVLAGGIVLPMALLAAGGASTPAVGLASALALAGLWLWEDLWVKAGQSVPLS